MLRRLFLKYNNGKCVNQHVGINKILEIPSLIAKWLGKEFFEGYTGHCFRRTSATLLVNARGNMTSFKRHGGWKATAIAESYIEEKKNKIDISNKISNCQPSNSQGGQAISNCQPSTSHESMADEISDYRLCTSGETKDSCDEVCEKTLGNNSSVKSSSGINVGNNCSNCTINFYFNHK
jgi:hypothetical protein